MDYSKFMAARILLQENKLRSVDGLLRLNPGKT